MKREYNPYTQEQKNFLRENISKFGSYEELANAASAFFGFPRSRQAIQSKCKEMGLKIGKNRGCFFKGSRTRAVPIGTVRKAQNGTYVKISDVGTGVTGYSYPDWVPLQKYIYEKAFGKLKDGEQVIFLDGNKNNYDLENLYPVDMKVKAYLARNRLYSHDPKITKSAIFLAKLILTIGGIK